MLAYHASHGFILKRTCVCICVCACVCTIVLLQVYLVPTIISIVEFEKDVVKTNFLLVQELLQVGFRIRIRQLEVSVNADLC